MKPKRRLFSSLAKAIADYTGHPLAFILAVTVVVIWAVTGPLFGFSDTWQLVINTSTTIITFLMVFLIQNAQNRDTHALQIKLDELIRVTEGAHTALLDLEELDDRQICAIRTLYQQIARESRQAMKQQDDDTHVPHIELPGEETAASNIRSKRKKS